MRKRDIQHRENRESSLVLCGHPLINTPLERGGYAPGDQPNRFSGFPVVARLGAVPETAEAVDLLRARSDTPLKRGVNGAAAGNFGDSFNSIDLLNL
jgi:hypothetical protein